MSCHTAGDETLGRDELSALASSVGRPLSGTELDACMCELDKDGDGTVTMWEVVQAVQRMHRVFATAQQQSSTGEAEVEAAPEPRAEPV